MRAPSDIYEEFGWWRDALAGIRHDIDPDDPRPGFYRLRLVRGGPWVGAAIWIEQEIDPETGELTDDERMVCIVNGKERDLFTTDTWTWLALNPIPEEEFRFLAAHAAWAKRYAPTEPDANPFQKVDPLAMAPVF